MAKLRADLASAGLLAALALVTLAFGADYWLLATRIAIMMLFALSVDLLVGVAGIITLGHALFFGLGAYTVGVASIGWGIDEPVTGIALAGLISAIAGLATGALVLRARGLGQLMLTLAFAALAYEAANRAKSWTGGADGLQGVVIAPLLGRFEFDIFGFTPFVYALVVLATVMALAVMILHSPFGRSLAGIRENPTRMAAVGAPVKARLLAIYTVAASMAGVAGALLAQTSAFVGLDSLEFGLSGEGLVMVALGGAGRLWGALVGALVLTLVKDRFSALDPAYWYLWVGLLLGAIVLFAPKGLVGLLDRGPRS